MELSIARGSGAVAPDDRAARRNGFRALYFKEMRDYFRSMKFLIVLALIVVLGMSSVYGAFSSMQESISSSDSTVSNTILSLFTTQYTWPTGATWPSFIWFMMFMGPIVGLALGFDAINGERSRRTLSRLLAQPIHRDAVVNGKFLAGVTVLAIMVFSLGFAISGAGIVLLGLVPTLEEVLRIVIFLFFTTVYMSLFLALSLLFSLLFRHMATSALMGIAVWLFFALFMSLLAGLISGVLFPITDSSSTADQLNNYQCEQAINRLSPATLYSESVVTILDPTVRTLGVVLSSQLQNAVVGNLPVGQSLLLVWPHLTGLIALTMICFAVSYVCFMRQEVRAD
jgi:ABC-2 type transport system permease protein